MHSKSERCSSSLRAQKGQTSPYLFEQSHGKLLVWNTVFCCADVLSTLCADMEVDSHQEVLLRNTWERHQLMCVVCTGIWSVIVWVRARARVWSLLSVGALVNLTVGAASIFHKKPTDSLTEHIYYQSIRHRLSGTHIKRTRRKREAQKWRKESNKRVWKEERAEEVK